MPGAFCCLKAAMNTFDMDLEADCDLGVIADVRHDRLPLRLALRSDVANIVDALLTLRALQALDHGAGRSEEHTSELQSQSNLVCRLLLEKKKKQKTPIQAKDTPNQ